MRATPPPDDDAAPSATPAVPPEEDAAPSAVPAVPTDDDAVTALALALRQRDRLLQHICWLTGLDEHAADDVLSDVTERVLRNNLAPRDGESWFGYMAQATKNEAANKRRAADRARAREVRAFRLAGRDQTVDGVALRMLWLDVMDDLATLPELDRKVFVLRHFEDKTYADIAAALDVSEDVVDKRLRQATAVLRTRLTEREKRGAYVLLLALGRTAHGTTVSAPPVVVAGAAALAMLAVVTVPLPGALRLPARNLPVARAVVAGSRGGGDLTGTEGDVGRVLSLADGPKVIGPVAGSGPRPRSSGRALAPVAVGGCVVRVCVSGGTGGTAAAGQSGDAITVHPLNGTRFWQNVTPVCWAVPDNPEVTCESSTGQPYVIPPPRQEHPAGEGKSEPSAPATQGPLKGPTP